MVAGMADWSLLGLISAFTIAAMLVAVAGTRLCGIADRLADRTGLGEAMTGAILLGASTSLPGITASVTAAALGRPELALSNAIGGIAAQTAFLALADFSYSKANLEHAAPSIPNILNGTLVITLLGGVLLASCSPNVSVLGIHPMTFVLALGYFGGLRLARRAHTDPLWKPQVTQETTRDVPEPADPDAESMASLWGQFLGFAGLMAAAGWTIAQSGAAIADRSGLDDTVMGTLFTAIFTSTPELVTTLAAVRRGALTLAVGGVLGGNAFDVMFAVASDVAYREGSIYHAIGPSLQFLTALSIVMSGVLVMGMLYREKRGVANIGFESALMLALYLGGILILIGW